MDYRDRGFHARGLYLTQDTLRMGTARGKQGWSSRIIAEEQLINLEERNVDAKREQFQTKPNYRTRGTRVVLLLSII